MWDTRTNLGRCLVWGLLERTVMSLSEADIQELEPVLFQELGFCISSYFEVIYDAQS